MTTQTTYQGGKAWTVSINADTAAVYWQAINPCTGKGWQAQRDFVLFQGEGFKRRALRDWLKRSTESRFAAS